MLYLIGGFSIVIMSIAYKVFIHDEFIEPKLEPYNFKQEYNKLRDYLFSSVIKRIHKFNYELID